MPICIFLTKFVNGVYTYTNLFLRSYKHDMRTKSYNKHRVQMYTHFSVFYQASVQILNLGS